MPDSPIVPRDPPSEPDAWLRELWMRFYEDRALRAATIAATLPARSPEPRP